MSGRKVYQGSCAQTSWFRGSRLSVVLIWGVLVTLTLSSAAEAGKHHTHERWQKTYRIRRGAGWHARMDMRQWHQGRWMQTWHAHRYGWWWLAGATWVLYSTPVYPYPDPATVPLLITETPGYPPPVPPGISPASRYFCPGLGFYPVVLRCPVYWQVVP